MAQWGAEEGWRQEANLGGLSKSREGSGGAERGPGSGKDGGDISVSGGSAVDVGSSGGVEGTPQ